MHNPGDKLRSMRSLVVLLLAALLSMPALAANPVSDDTLYDQIRIRLANDREIGGNPIDVKVTDGHVELTGKVKTEKQKTRAEKETKKVKGVKDVVNKLAVSPV